jgi:hypothetical protein
MNSCALQVQEDIWPAPRGASLNWETSPQPDQSRSTRSHDFTALRELVSLAEAPKITVIIRFLVFVYSLGGLVLSSAFKLFLDYIYLLLNFRITFFD